jgi:predicted enzyme related to lactoylglutathione lyase
VKLITLFFCLQFFDYFAKKINQFNQCKSVATMFNKLRTVIYHVTNLQQAKEWYTNLTGIKPYFDEPFYVGFDINGCELGLDPDLTGITAGNYSVAYWSVTEIENCVKKLLELGATIIEDVNEVGGGVKVAVVNDLWGNAIGLIEGA